MAATLVAYAVRGVAGPDAQLYGLAQELVHHLPYHSADRHGRCLFERVCADAPALAGRQPVLAQCAGGLSDAGHHDADPDHAAVFGAADH